MILVLWKSSKQNIIILNNYDYDHENFASGTMKLLSKHHADMHPLQRVMNYGAYSSIAGSV